MREFITTFKFRSSFLFSVVALLIVVIAGLLKDVRFVTIIWRSLLAFFVAGCISYLIIFILEHKGIINFDEIEDELEIQKIQEKMQAETNENDSKNKEESTENDENTENEQSEEGGGFTPLNADNLQKVAS